jgi:hypothetical protein
MINDLRDALALEGYTEEDMAIWDGWNVATEDGFFTLKMEHDLPYMVHFCVKRDRRGGPAYLRLLRTMKNVVRGLGFPKMILNIPRDNDFVRRVASNSFGVEKPYDANVETEFYLVEV